MNERILIIEDDQAILKLLQRGLAYEGYTVDTATYGRTGLILARDHTPDLVILDWMLPGMDGLEVCHRLRTGGSIPILMLTAKDTVQDRIQGLDAGADDYMIKPFSSGELVARARALLRRKPRLEDEVLAVGDLKLDTKRHTVTRNKKAIELRPKEYELLECLMLHEGIALTRQMLLEHVWDMNVDLFTNTIEAHIRSLRQKLGKPDLIHTIHGAGYKIAAKR
jgi:two-component system, OmpR family, response regulator MprA